MYKIFESEQEFVAKNNEIMESGVCGNATKYADEVECKHPTLNKWAMPVMPYVTQFFDESELIDTLTSDWQVIIEK